MEEPSFWLWFLHGSLSQSINQSIRRLLWRRCCRNSIVFLKRLLSKWPWCATCGTGRLNTGGSHWETQTDLCTGPWPRSARAPDPDLSKCLTSLWTSTRQIISKLTIQGQNVKAEHFAFLSSLFAHLWGFSWPIKPFPWNFNVFKTTVAKYLILQQIAILIQFIMERTET